MSDDILRQFEKAKAELKKTIRGGALTGGMVEYCPTCGHMVKGKGKKASSKGGMIKDHMGGMIKDHMGGMIKDHMGGMIKDHMGAGLTGGCVNCVGGKCSCKGGKAVGGKAVGGGLVKKGKKPKGNNDWVNWVKCVQDREGVSYKEAMKIASRERREY